MRSLPPAQYLLLKTASRTLIATCGGVEGAATLTRVGKSALSDYAHPDKLDCFMPIDVACDLTVNSGARVMFDAMQVIAGAKNRCRASLATSTAAVMSETGDVLKSTAKAMKDKRLRERERRDITLQVQEAIGSLTDLLSSLQNDGDADA